MKQSLQEYMLEQLKNLIDIQSPTGYTDKVQEYVFLTLTQLGFSPKVLNKGGVICELGGDENAMVLAAHVDTLGAAIKTIKSNGRLKVTPIGGLNANNIETENVSVITRFDGSYEGTFQIENASTHVNKNVNAERTFETNIEIVLDEFVSNTEDVKKLGIANGDIVAIDPRFAVTKQGYIKSRFLDDKASAAVLLTIAKAVSDKEFLPNRKIYLNFTVYEEVGHGGAAAMPNDAKDIISVDMGCVGDELSCTEKQVSICAKDSAGPYNYALTTELISAAKKAGIDFAIDVYPMYASDADVALKAGYDVRHGLIGPGVYASHGYERTHKQGLENTYKLLYAYLNK